MGMFKNFVTLMEEIRCIRLNVDYLIAIEFEKPTFIDLYYLG